MCYNIKNILNRGMIMAKLYFKYGAMGSSKSAQALIAKYNYEERGMKVWLIKPKTDTRDGANIIKSRIGLFAAAEEISSEDSIKELFSRHGDCDHRRRMSVLHAGANRRAAGYCGRYGRSGYVLRSSHRLYNSAFPGKPPPVRGCGLHTGD